jgi:hypothetical protein
MQMPKTRHLELQESSQRDNQSAIADFRKPQPFGCGFFCA